jgi:cbb3-type cytochrome oxidase maturation protein
MDITFYLFFIALLVSFAAWCLFLWAIRTGQFHDVEDIKYQVWPRGEDGERGDPGWSDPEGRPPPALGARGDG